MVNYLTNSMPYWGWRISLGVAAVPAIIVIVGALLVTDSPSSLVLRGEPDKARASLQRIRGSDANIEAEFKDIVCAVEEACRNEQGAFKRLCNRGYRPYAVMMVAIPVFFQFTGMIVVFVFAPVLFRTVGFNSQKAILGSAIVNLVTLCAVVTSTFVVDRYGRRSLFLIGGISMILFQVLCMYKYISFILKRILFVYMYTLTYTNGTVLCKVAVSWILAEHLGKHNAVTMDRSYAMAVLVLMCLYTFSLGLSWDSLKWVILSEIHPVETRSVDRGAGDLHDHRFHPLLCTGTGVHDPALQSEIRDIPLLCRLGAGHDGFHHGVPAGDQRSATRGYAGSMGTPLVLEEILRAGRQARA
jgi:MFS family permease